MAEKDVPVVFVNSVVQSGFSNGIYNVAFSTARYIPGPVPAPTPDDPTKTKIAATSAEFISANLRMDLYCVQQLHDSLAQILEEQTKPKPKSEIN
jgi:hypothetical protein